MAFSLLYLGMCRILGLVLSGRRGESDKDVEIMVLRHQVRILERVGAENLIRRTDQGLCTRKNVGTCRATYIP